MKLILMVFIGIISLPITIEAKDLEEHGAKCKDIGFKPKTPAYGDCVLELRRRDVGSSASSLVKSTPGVSVSKTKAKGDGSPDDTTCIQYGFNVGTEQYSQCRLQLNLAKRQFEAQQAQYEQEQLQHQQELSQYEAQIAVREQARKRAREEEKNLKLMELGFRIMGGQSVGDASMATAGIMPLPPQAPTPPVYQNFSVHMPGGKNVHCTYNSAVNQVYCY